MSDLRKEIIRLAAQRPDLRPYLLPLVASSPLGPQAQAILQRMLQDRVKHHTVSPFTPAIKDLERSGMIELMGRRTGNKMEARLTPKGERAAKRLNRRASEGPRLTMYESTPSYYYDEDHKKWALFKVRGKGWRLEDLKANTRHDFPDFDEAIRYLRQKVGPVRVHHIHHRKAQLRRADRWDGPLPKGWTDQSRKKFWDTLTSTAPKHKVTKCIDKLTGKLSNPGAFCAAIADREMPGWRQEVAKERREKKKKQKRKSSSADR